MDHLGLDQPSHPLVLLDEQPGAAKMERGGEAGETSTENQHGFHGS
jgi:hypothetical protein